MRTKSVITTLLLIATLALGVGAVYIGYTLSQESQAPDPSGATGMTCPNTSAQAVYCVTWDCPNGDTAAPFGQCTAADEGAGFTGSTSGCGPSTTGCGQVDYYTCQPSTQEEWSSCYCGHDWINLDDCGGGEDPPNDDDSDRFLEIIASTYCVENGTKYPMPGIGIKYNSNTHSKVSNKTTRCRGADCARANTSWFIYTDVDLVEEEVSLEISVVDIPQNKVLEATGQSYSQIEFSKTYCNRANSANNACTSSSCGTNQTLGLQKYSDCIMETSESYNTDTYPQQKNVVFEFTNCTPADDPPPICGDNKCDEGETCETIDDIPTDCMTNEEIEKCRVTCDYCGDGEVQAGEQCDHGGDPDESCSIDCTLPEVEELPETAIIDDQSDRILVAFSLILIGIAAIKFDVVRKVHGLSPLSSEFRQRKTDQKKNIFEKSVTNHDK